jgi:alkylhydroperoxidase family enzyme
MHTRDLIKKGVKIEKLALVQASAEAGHLYSERCAASVSAEAVTRVSETGVPDEAFEAARATRRGAGRSHDAISLMNA